MHLDLDEVARATGGRAVGPADRRVDGATNDSRALRPGQLFVAIRDERDGHDFVPAARNAGAGAVLVDHEVDEEAAVLVDDTRAALTALGRHARARLDAVVVDGRRVAVVGITGSVGKTSVKDLTAAATSRSRRTAASVRSFNNELGVPLTLLEAHDEAEVAVVEMGARGIGHIRDLCAVARPTIGVVTAVALAHTEAFGTIDDVALAKGELVEALPPEGTAVLNLRDERVAAMAGRTEATVLTYGVERGDVRAEGVVLDDDLRPRFRLATPWGDQEVALAVRGRHNAENAAGAAAAALAAGAELASVAEGLAGASLSPWRMELLVTPAGTRVLNDAYNANPTSVLAALEALDDLPAERRTAVLGPMAELGAVSDAEHRRVADRAAELGIRVVPVDTDAYGGTTAKGVDGALRALGRLDAGDAVLVKASRVAGLERLAQRLVDG
ncbi:MAG TPA: UDP-N-acetylmuramoyl-tripeptide--D-alanyl-D-alanine ligase [Acidimicrobiales bacterium]|nr:UDP-N-acetylmuramoyl-tripeptide--D-alanyl-D-alanine ligase [Acidimicrobiales bacterium]